jgi:hypothetical protein
MTTFQLMIFCQCPSPCTGLLAGPLLPGGIEPGAFAITLVHGFARPKQEVQHDPR